MYPDGPIAGCGYFVSFNVQKLIGGNVLRQDKSSMCLERSRKYDAMENDVVLSDEVYQFRVILAPVIRPIRRQFLGGADVADRRVEPDVQHLPFCVRQGNLHAPLAVARHGAGLEAAVEPALTLSVDIVLPVFMPFQDPFLQPGFIILQREIPVLRFPLHRNGIAEC